MRPRTLAAILPVFAAGAFVACAFVACSGKSAAAPPECKPSPVKLASWTRTPLKYREASMLVPADARNRLIPTSGGSVGEAWDGGGFGIYYKLDSVRTEHTVETGPQVSKVMTCTTEIDDVPGTLTVLHSNATSISGEFGQAQWSLPDGKTLFVAVLTREPTARDSVVSLLQSVRFGKTSR